MRVIVLLLALCLVSGDSLAQSAGGKPPAAPATAAPASPDAALCQAQNRLEALRASLEKSRPEPDLATPQGIAARLAGMAGDNLRIREALYAGLAEAWPDEVKRAYAEYFLNPRPASPAEFGLAQRVAAAHLAEFRRLLETNPLLKDGWPSRKGFGPEADFHAFVIVAQGRGGDPRWVAETVLPRLQTLAAKKETSPLAPAWLAAGAAPDLARFQADFARAEAPWNAFAAQVEGLQRFMAMQPALAQAPRLPPLTPAPCGGDGKPTPSGTTRPVGKIPPAGKAAPPAKK